MMKWVYRLIELMSDWKHLIIRGGLRSAWIVILKELIQLPYRHIEYVVLAYPLSNPITKFESELVIEIRPFLKNDLDYVRREFFPSEANMCNQRIKAGHQGLVATSNYVTIGYCWLCKDDKLERVNLPMLPGDILITDSFTSPSFRGKGVQTKIGIAALQYAKRLGFKRFIMYIEVNNASSLAVWQKKMGADIIGHIDFKRIGFWRRTHFK